MWVALPPLPNILGHQKTPALRQTALVIWNWHSTRGKLPSLLR
jgi:hypothetical protein